MVDVGMEVDVVVSRVLIVLLHKHSEACQDF